MAVPSRAAAILSLMVLSAGLAHAQDAPAPPDPALGAAVDGERRNPRFLAFDAARHPVDELTFFGLKSDMTVVELWPAGGYWTEILAPYLRDGGGTLIAAMEVQPPGSPERDAATKRFNYFNRRVADDPALFAGLKVSAFGPGTEAIAPANSVDLILSFRELHLWMKQGFAEEALVACYKALKPGGILALEDHRGNRAGEQDVRAADGYVREDYAKGLARLAGFEFVASSEIEANPRDTADWPHGVTTLAPTFALGAQDRARYEAVGEADNFVLKFRKPL
ncbi:class I SAM-dependent methyltransferase [Lichenibacterium minor]|uniref:class I SAM-dependent methyltransferase n=1 Tax=Lichenibacterium minor TaxID=2316528 RepID=UPI001A91EAEF|nr:class I SAM-dependent methyltransferase [Lichenibacterium minor]